MVSGRGRLRLAIGSGPRTAAGGQRDLEARLELTTPPRPRHACGPHHFANSPYAERDEILTSSGPVGRWFASKVTNPHDTPHTIHRDHLLEVITADIVDGDAGDRLVHPVALRCRSRPDLRSRVVEELVLLVPRLVAVVADVSRFWKASSVRWCRRRRLPFELSLVEEQRRPGCTGGLTSEIFHSYAERVHSAIWLASRCSASARSRPATALHTGRHGTAAHVPGRTASSHRLLVRGSDGECKWHSSDRHPDGV